MRRCSDKGKAIHNIRSGPRPGGQELGLPLIIHGETSHRRRATSRRRSEERSRHRHHTRRADLRKSRASLARMDYNCIDAGLKACISISSENLYQYVSLVSQMSRRARRCMKMMAISAMNVSIAALSSCKLCLRSSPASNEFTFAHLGSSNIHGVDTLWNCPIAYNDKM